MQIKVVGGISVIHRVRPRREMKFQQGGSTFGIRAFTY